MISKCVSKSWHHMASNIIIKQSIPKNPTCGFFITNDSIGIGDDMWFEILSKLPLKPLMRFKCVSKSCHQMASSIITNSLSKNPICGFFITSRSNAEKTCFQYLPIKRVDGDEEKSSSCYDSLTSLPSHPRPHIVDSRDGFLLCSSSLRQKDYFIYNPITRQCISLPKPPIPIIGCSVNAIAKLVFDDSSGFYKVVRIAIGRSDYNADDWALFDPKFGSPHIFVDIYSSEMGKWTMSIELDLPWLYFRPILVFFDGGIYWLGRDRTVDGFTISRFDVNDESCGFVKSPPGTALNSSDCLGACEGRLCYAQHITRCRGDHCVEVWEFNDEKEWVLKYDVEDFLQWEWEFKVMGFHPYWAAVFVMIRDGFHWYDLAMGKIERTVSCHPPIQSEEGFYNFMVYPFSEFYIHRKL